MPGIKHGDGTANAADDYDILPPHGFRADVQALRGVAVLAVVLYHANVVAPGGYAGVDVFFVISGFVIGRVLLAELIETGRVSFTSFYARRARRLLPALSLLLVTVALAAPLFAPLGSVATTTRTAIAAALFSANLYLYRIVGAGYFTADAEHNPLLHTWSLSVEEQFYFLVPLLIVLTWQVGQRARRPVRALRLLVVALLLVSLAANVAFTYLDPLAQVDGLRFAFYAPVTRAWQFAAGIAIVVLPTSLLPTSPRAPKACAAAGGALLVACFLLFTEETVFPGVAAAVPTIGAVLLILAGSLREPSQMAAAPPLHRPLVFLGDVSYSWYLWHWPFIVFAHANFPLLPEVGALSAALLSLLPAWLSYQYVERRARSVAATPRRAGIVAIAAVTVPVLIATAGVPLIARQAREQLPTLEYEAARREHVGSSVDCDSTTPLSERDLSACQWGEIADESAPSVLLIGDSNAGHFSASFIAAAERVGAKLTIATMSACPLADVVLEEYEFSQPERCRTFVQDALDEAAATENGFHLVIVANSTDGYVDKHRIRLPEESDTARSRAEREEVFRVGLERSLRQLRQAGTQVALVGTVPKPRGWDPRECSRVSASKEGDNDCLSSASAILRHDITALERSVASRAGAHYWDFNPALCPGGECQPRLGGAWLWRDSGHISVAAAETLVDEATTFLREALELD